MSAMTPMVAADFTGVGTSVNGSTVLYRDTRWGGNFFLRVVSSLSEAIAIGGVMILHKPSGHAVMFAGAALRQWIAAGGGVPKLYVEFGHRLASSDKAGFRRSGLPAAAHMYEYNTWHYSNQTLPDVVFCGVPTTAETGFGTTSMSPSATPFFGNPVGGFKVDNLSPVPATRTVQPDGMQLDDLPFGNNPPSACWAFMVTQIPHFESFRHHLDRMLPKLLGGKGDSYVTRAWGEVVTPIVDYIPHVRTLWVYKDGNIHHGPGGSRRDLGKSQPLAMMNYLNTHRDDAVWKNGLTTACQLYSSLGNVGFSAPLDRFMAKTDNASENFTEDFRTDSHVFGILPFGPCDGPITLPAIMTGAERAEPFYASFRGSNPFDGDLQNFSMSNGSLKSLAIPNPTGPEWRAEGGAWGNPVLIDLPYDGLVGQVGVTDFAVLHRSSLVGQYALDDGSKRPGLRLTSWTDFMYGKDMTSESFATTMVPSGDLQVDLANVQSHAGQSDQTFPPKITWMAWGKDIFDDTFTVCSRVMDRAVEIARDENR